MAIRIIDTKSNVINSVSIIADIRVGDLVVDNYQRMITGRRLKKIMDNFDEYLVGIPVVSHRENGTLAILDGQHRVQAVYEMFGADAELQCEVLKGLSYEKEAEIFYKRNQERTPLKALEKFRSAIESRHPEALEVLEIMNRHGYQVPAKNNGDRDRGRVQAIGSILTVYREYRSGRLDEVLSLISKTWGVGTAPTREIIRGVAAFITQYNGVYDQGTFAKKVREVGINDLSRESLALRKAAGLTGDRATVLKIREYYNRGRGGGKLPLPEDI